MKPLPTALLDVLGGDIGRFRELLDESHEVLRSAAEQHQGLTLGRRGVAAALRTWHDGSCSDEEIQAWASFVRRGYIAGSTKGPVTAIVIEYEEAHEDVIVEVVGRLDQIGDLVDGVIDAEEVMELLGRLER